MPSHRDRSMRLAPTLLAAGACLGLALSASAQNTRLSGPLAAGASQAGDVRAFALDVGGTFAAYLADQDDADVIELYGVPLDGSASPVKLNGPLVAGGDVLDAGAPGFALAPEGGRVVYLADADEDETFELYSVPRDASAAPVKLSPSLAGGDVHAFRLGATGAVAAFLLDASGGGSFDLWSAPLDGSASALLLAAAVATDDSLPFEISADETRAVYLFAGRLFSVPLDASASPLDLAGPLVAGGAVEGTPSFRLQPGGGRVVFRADKLVDDVFELFSVPVDGSASPVKLNGPLIAGIDVGAYQITPDGTRVLLFAKALYSVPIQGGVNPLNLSLSGNFVVSPDSSRVVYAQNLGGGLQGLFSRAVGGGPAAVRLDAGGSVASCAGGVTFAISPDSSRVAFLENDGELYGAPIDGSASRVQLSAGGVRSCAAGGAFPLALPISADGRVLYFADAEVDGEFALYSVPVDGSAAPVRLNEALVCGGAVETGVGLQPAVAGASAVYLADQDLDEVRELYVVPADRSQSPARLNAPLSADAESGDVAAFELAPGGAFAVYLADPDEDERLELFSVATQGPAAAQRLSGTLARCGDVALFRVSPDATRVVFSGDHDSDGVDELFVAPLDGSAAPLKLSAPFGAGGGVGSSPYPAFAPLEFTPDSSRVLFYARASASEPLVMHSAALDGSGSVSLVEASAFRLSPDGASAACLGVGGELFAVPCDGSGLPLGLSGPPAPGASLLNAWSEPEFAISPDGQSLVFAAEFRVPGVVELFSVPLDGSSAPVKLNTNLVLGGDVRGTTPGAPSFALSADGQRVVCSGDPFFDERFEVLMAPIDGSALWVELNGALVAGGDVLDFALTADGVHVVYRADQQQNERFELFQRRVDALGVPLKLSGTLGSSRDVLAGYQTSADSSRVVYQADALSNDLFELFSAPLDASAAPLCISGPLTSGGAISGALRLQPGGDFVAYLADANVDERFELFRVPLDRAATPARVSGELVAGGDVLPAPGGFAFGRGAHVFYLADQVRDGVVELFTNPLHARTSSAPTRFR